MQAKKGVLCIFISVGVSNYYCSTIMRSIDELYRIECAILSKIFTSLFSSSYILFAWDDNIMHILLVEVVRREVSKVVVLPSIVSLSHMQCC